MLLRVLDQAPRRILAFVAGVCVAMLVFGLYLQHSLGLEPCPMCIVQRYALVLVGLFAGCGALFRGRGMQSSFAFAAVAAAGFGAFVAARQSWLQWNPPEIATCGRDLYGMIETFPLKRAIPMIFQGGGDCTVIDWTFLGGSIANWSFLCFLGLALVLLVLIVRPSSVRR